MIGNRRIGGSLKNRMPMASPLMSKSIISGAIVFFVAFFAAFISSSVLTPTKVSDATNLTTANIAFTGYFVKMNTQDVTMNLLTTPTGAMTVVDSTVKTVTNSPNGYKLYLSMSSYDTSGNEKSFNDKLKNGLYLNGDLSRTDNMVVNAAPGKGGSTASASLAALSDNTWGYAVDKNSAGAPDIWLNENHSTMSSTTPTNDKFAAVPKATEVDLIQETSSSNLSYNASESDVQDSDYTDANLYYGIRGNAGLSGGSYTNTIAYTAVGKTEPSGTLTFNPASYTFSAPYESMTWTDTVTIQTPLYTSAEDLGTATVTLSGGPDNVSGLACSNPTLSVYNNLLNVTCTLPQAHAGNYDVLVYLDKYGQIYTGSYIYIDPYDQSYTITMNNSNVTTNAQTLSIPYGGTGYVKVTPGNGYYLSSVTCPNGYICSGYLTGVSQVDAYNTQTIKIENSGATADGTLVIAGVSSTLSTMQDQTAIDACKNASVGASYNLRDTRDNNIYTVRKLADGKCWMVQNLRLHSPTNGYIDASDSNVNSQIAWDTIAATDNCSGTNSCVYYGGDATFGTYYSWYAATAGSGTSSMVYPEIAPYSVCPKGWHLPTGGNTSSEFQALYNQYSSWSQMLSGFPNFTLAGGRSETTMFWVSENGNYWSSTAEYNGSAYHLHFLGSDSTVHPSMAHSGEKMGYSVRCVAQ